MRWIAGGVTVARGFRASGVRAGIKRSGKPDVALVVSDRLASAAGVVTTNRIKAAPVLITQARLRRGFARAVLINSGCANCLTGQAGLEDAKRFSRACASGLKIPEGQLLVASTGLIGRRLPLKRLLSALPRLIERLSPTRHREAATAILTTDSRLKEAALAARLRGRTCRLGGMVKGAGMIAPNMATMLCVLTTDAAISPPLLRDFLRDAVATSFNRISVDGDMSTNDTVILLANGRSGVQIRRGTPEAEVFAAMLQRLTQRLAWLLIKDGEGATRVARIEVVGAASPHEALGCARAVATSSLVKTMLAGGDPNVGRIAAAVGTARASFDPEHLEISVGSHRVVQQGQAIRLGNSRARELFARPEIAIRIDLHAGRSRAEMLTCDLTEDYVRLNARYST